MTLRISASVAAPASRALGRRAAPASRALARRIAAAAAGALGGALLFAGVAAAHVTVNPHAAPAGGYQELTFRVPTESDTASTTKVQVYLPTDHPVASVSVQPVPGWKIAVTKSKLAKPIKSDDGDVTEAVTLITWSGGKLAPGQFQDFPVSLGPLPTGTGQLVFKALQTYSDGSVVRWIDPTKAGDPEPDHPAPVLTLTAPGASEQGASAQSGDAKTNAAPAAAAATGTKSDSDTLARTLGGVGIGLGVIGLLGAVVALRRRPTAGPQD